jgi:hypothetical protein
MDVDMPDLPVGLPARPGAKRDADAVLALLQAWDLLLASFQRLASHGLSEVRLGVYASNRSAQNLYVGAGMTLLTEWQVWMRPA